MKKNTIVDEKFRILKERRQAKLASPPHNVIMSHSIYQ